MGHNRSGVRHKQKKNRRKREQLRLEKKAAAGETAQAGTTDTAAEKK